MVDAPQHLRGWDRRRRLIVFVAVLAGEIAPADRNDLRGNGMAGGCESFRRQTELTRFSRPLNTTASPCRRPHANGSSAIFPGFPVHGRKPISHPVTWGCQIAPSVSEGARQTKPS